jgi:hypothetical protein
MNKVFERYKKTDRQKLWKTKKEAQENFHKLYQIVTGGDFIVVCEVPGYHEEQAPYNPLELE